MAAASIPPLAVLVTGAVPQEIRKTIEPSVLPLLPFLLTFSRPLLFSPCPLSLLP